MSGLVDLQIRLARPEERDELEALQRRASLALGDYREQLEANPDAIELPLEQIERGEVTVARSTARSQASPQSLLRRIVPSWTASSSSPISGGAG